MTVLRREGQRNPAMMDLSKVGQDPCVNDFSIRFANINGSGSASANRLLLKGIFRIGVPVSGKNVFPSNIQGLPTWYEIRVSDSGYIGRSDRYDIVVAMNGQTYAEDMASVAPGGYFLHDSSWPLDNRLEREDVHMMGIPLSEECTRLFPEPKERVLLRNIACIGAVGALIDLDQNMLGGLLDEIYAKSPGLQASNRKALELGYFLAGDRFDCPLPLRVEPRNQNAGKVLIDGNTALALGCVYAGATVAAWYPITPATSVSENFQKLCERFRSVEVKAEDGSTEVRKEFAVIQAEDEMAALGMVIGASWAGARAFTSTSGPGISLMNELLGLAYYSEIPAVIFDVQRTGPSTGMPTRVQQSDLLAGAYASHGDTKHLMLFPSNPTECFNFAVQAFDLSDRFQTPVLVLSDLDIGMNDWVTDEFTWDDSYVWDRGRILSAEQLAELPFFLRYSDPDDHYVTSRTLPGQDPKGAFFTRGSGHDKFGGYTEQPAAYQEVMERLELKHRASADSMPEPVVRRRDGVQGAVVTIGSNEPAVLEALDHLEKEGISLDYMRVRGFPFQQSVKDFIEEHECCMVIEQNRDAQLRSLLVLELGIDPAMLLSVTSYGGFPMTASYTAEQIKQLLKG